MTIFLVNTVICLGLCVFFTYSLYKAEIRGEDMERKINNMQEKYTNPPEEE
jgi:hypothetical protein